MPMELLFVWLIAFGCAAGSLAKGKNRSVALWVIVGMVIGPFAVLIIALMKPVPGVEQDYS